jgi:hypothetical protein
MAVEAVTRPRALAGWSTSELVGLMGIRLGHGKHNEESALYRD